MDYKPWQLNGQEGSHLPEIKVYVNIMVHIHANGEIMKTYPKLSSPCTCLNLRRASKAITEYYDNYLKAEGISVSQLVLLRYVDYFNSMTMTHLAERMRIDRTTLNRNVKPLVDQGFLAIVPGKDSRTREIRLLDEGKQKLQKSLVLWEQAQQDVQEYLGIDNVEKLTELAAKIEALVP